MQTLSRCQVTRSSSPVQACKSFRRDLELASFGSFEVEVSAMQLKAYRPRGHTRSFGCHFLDVVTFRVFLDISNHVIAIVVIPRPLNAGFKAVDIA